MRNLFGVLFVLIVILLAPSIASAITLNLDYPAFGGFDLNVEADQSLPAIIAFFYFFMIGISGLAAFVMLVVGGVQWLLSGAAPAQAGAAKERIRSAILGLLLILASVLILQVINPALAVIPGSTLIGIDCALIKFAEKCKPLTLNLADGSTVSRLPTGATKDGVYLCFEEGCRCRDESKCNQGADPDDAEPDNDDPTREADYLYIDPTIFVPCDTAGLGCGLENLDDSYPSLGDLDWNDNVKAVAIKGDFGVLLADGINYTQTVTCFDNRTGGRLEDYERKRNMFDPKKFFVGWGENGAQSLKILEEESLHIKSRPVPRKQHTKRGLEKQRVQD